MSVSKSNQAGSATTFVIIGIILLGLLLGGIYYVVQRGEQVRKDAEATKIARDQEATQKAKNAETAAKNAPTNSPTTNPSPTTTATNTPTTHTPLPTTGTETDIVRVIAVGLLAGTVTSFIMSQRGLKRPL